LLGDFTKKRRKTNANILNAITIEKPF